MVSAQEMQTKFREAPAQSSVVAASVLTLLAFFFSIGGLAGVWWAGSHEMSIRRHQVQVDFASTLWETTVKSSVAEGSTDETRTTIDDVCAENDLSDELESRCSKFRTVRAFVFLKFLACLASVTCAVVWLYLEVLHSSGGTILMRKRLLISAVSCNAFACFSALLAVIIASTVDVEYEDIGVNGGGFVITILSLVLCLAPGLVLEMLALRWAYWLPAAPPSAAKPVDVPNVAPIGTAVAGREQNGTDLEAAKTECS